MWKKRNTKPSKETAGARTRFLKNAIKPVGTTVISAGSKFKGSIETEGNLVIDGSVTGTIKCGSLEIMQDGNVDADIESERVNVAGNFVGEMVCRGRLTFYRTGKVKGDISYGTLSIESGGLLDGSASRFK